MTAPRTFAAFIAECEAAREIINSDIPSSQVAAQVKALGWDVSPGHVRHYRQQHCGSSAHENLFSAQDRAALHAKLDELLDQADPAAVHKLIAKAWDVTLRNELGEAETVRNYGLTLESAQWQPAWPIVAPAAPVKVMVTTPPPEVHRKHKTAVILPDPQIGYRLYGNDTRDPFHDLAAIDVALQITAAVQPDLVVWLGDYLDLAEFSRFEQEAAFARSTQAAIDYGHELLAKVGALVPGAHQVLLEGNHDRRLQKHITANAMAAFGLRQAGHGWPVLSVPHLLRLDELGVEYVGGYPAGEYWLNDRLKCIHGVIVRSSGSTARAVADDETVSVLHGHTHRAETAYKTTRVRSGGRTRVVHSPGCLCRIDGAVPSTKGSTMLDERPVQSWENWTQGLAVVHYQDGDGPFNVEPSGRTCGSLARRRVSAPTARSPQVSTS